MSKFKVGDKVIGNALANQYSKTREGTIWNVIRAYSYCGCNTIVVQDDEGSPKAGFTVEAKCFDLLPVIQDVDTPELDAMFSEL